jgi:hypothetical protein
MPDFVIPLAEPFTAAERGRYEPAWRDGAWTVEPSPHEHGGIELRPGDTVTSVCIDEPSVIVQRDPQQEPDGALILGLPMGPNDVNASTVREYLIALLHAAKILKSPWGNSDWDTRLFIAFAAGGLLEMEYFEDGYYVKNYDRRRANELFDAAIGALGD